jgi:hypothetical protein
VRESLRLEGSVAFTHFLHYLALENKRDCDIPTGQTIVIVSVVPNFIGYTKLALVIAQYPLRCVAWDISCLIWTVSLLRRN